MSGQAEALFVACCYLLLSLLLLPSPGARLGWCVLRYHACPLPAVLNSAPYVYLRQEATTLSNTSVVIAPLAAVRAHDADDTNLQLVNISTPLHGTLEVLSCCNSVNTTNAGWFYNGGKQVADYRCV